MKVSAFIDTIESDIARLIIHENDVIFWPAKYLPKQVEPGAWIVIQISEDEDKQKEMMAEILTLREELMERKYDEE